MRLPIKQQSGFTLIELVVYAAVFILVIILLTSFVFDLIKAQNRTRISKELTENNKRALEAIVYEIKHAQEIYLPTSNLSADKGQLSLKTSQNAPSGEENSYIDIYLDDNDCLCVKRESSQPERMMSEDIKTSRLFFSSLGTSTSQTIRIKLTSFYDHPQAKYRASSTIITSAGLRND